MKSKAEHSKVIEILATSWYHQTPDLELPLPPTDNRRLRWLPSAKRFVSTHEAAKYRKTVATILTFVGNPPAASSDEPIILVYQATLGSRRRDSGNCLKALKDALWHDDKYVFAWELPPSYGTPTGVKLWFYTLKGKEKEEKEE